MSMDVYCAIVFLMGVLASVIALRISRDSDADKDALEKAAVLIWLIIIAVLSFIGSIGYVLSKIILNWKL